MKSKKSDEANLENKKGMLFLFSLVISLSIVLFAFEWKTKPKPVVIPDMPASTAIEEIYRPPVTKEKIELQKPKIEIQEVDIIGNDEKITEPFQFSTSEIEEPLLDFTQYLNKLPENNEEEEATVFLSPEQMPEFPGGEPALRKYLAGSVRYPVIAQENGIQGKVYVTFVINEKGGIENVALIRGIDPPLDEEALRVVRSLPVWKPGKQGGRAVKVRYTVPIVFELR
ncbi:energy transducer TonB [Maribellus maritimus]|uniref:energy transducer TonB n=1 Tax=Maribellus maritimus TaxID=2870838 RepID=UPI001EECA563|nr:energy transducer TonB [Maribellus maritimus]MCG6188657.1 TonB family protein [Maribellus maritimus]